VTHNVDEAIYLSDEIILLGARPAEVKDIIKVELPEGRWSYDIRTVQGYSELRSKIWKFLQSEIMTASGFGNNAS